jgi:hypothetical protein
MAALVVSVAILVLAVVSPAAAMDRRPSSEARARVEYHVRAVNDIERHFREVLDAQCPRFPSTGEWEQYFDSEVDRVVLLVAHVEQAWAEAKMTGDDDVRRYAKEPRKRLDEARVLLDKLHTCAADNGSSFNDMTVWRRIEQDVRRRQAEIALPE